MAKKKSLVDNMKLVVAAKYAAQEEVDLATMEGAKVLDMLIAKLSFYARHTDISKIKVKYGETKPLKPLYTNEGGNHVGYIQQGPRTLSLVIEDFIDDGRVKGIGD